MKRPTAAILFGGNQLAHFAYPIAEAHLTRRIDILHHHIVLHAVITRGLVGNMHLVLLLHQTHEGTAHADHIVVGMGREDQHALREWRGFHGARRIVGIGLTTRPPRNGVLQVVEDPDVDFIVGESLLQEFREGVLDIILVSQFQNRFLRGRLLQYRRC